ncbi:invasion associated locus B family protein [Methylobacterium sp. J-070]|uniref:invasion associated locus B family protein n=1 Tax=Methylobacterium sp. J-070 TaxID=2836650 RepID=UPI001FBB9249|nr:invasion associated locus B family protein [Methylobacterium sp. J-070]MCJ2049294.1 invasion associated locus B family protein [Methylobacterium sp. J-070]
MPFGLAIEPGITVKLDDQVLGKGAPYSSCTGESCLVPIGFPAVATDAMRTAKTLTVIGQKASGSVGAGEPAAITVPLVGFSEAFERVKALAG